MNRKEGPPIPPPDNDDDAEDRVDAYLKERGRESDIQRLKDIRSLDTKVMDERLQTTLEFAEPELDKALRGIDPKAKKRIRAIFDLFKHIT